MSNSRNHSMSLLEADSDPPFEQRQITIRTNQLLADNFDILDFLGRGKFGEVKKCYEKSTGRLLAGKFVSIVREQEKKDVLNEIEIMKSLQHPRLIQLYDVYQCGTRQMCLLLELITGGELFERVIDDDFTLTEQLCKIYMRQICEGVNFMHSSNILHLDMKPENILCMNRNGHRIKIIDFGLARKYDPNQTLRVLFGTPEFVAPEVVTYEKIGYGTDCWSIAVICYVLLSGLSPFMGENDLQTYGNIQNVNYDFDDESFESISEHAKDFIRKILVKNLNDRLTTDKCLEHPWLAIAQEDNQQNIIDTKNLRRFVIRRRWQKAVNALIALNRMGMTMT